MISYHSTATRSAADGPAFASASSVGTGTRQSVEDSPLQPSTYADRMKVARSLKSGFTCRQFEEAHDAKFAAHGYPSALTKWLQRATAACHLTRTGTPRSYRYSVAKHLR
jgi:hypothetical protein